MLYLVPTPIGNLRDITLRALDVLMAVDLVACEDTRRTAKLLKFYNIEQPLLSYHEHSGPDRVAKIMHYLENKKRVALVSDGGTPLISDPGFQLVHAAIQKGIPVEALPGASALPTALAVSGLAVDRFSFFGFLPVKHGARVKELESLKEREETLIFYESPYRILEVLKEMKEVFGDREAAVARELTKKFEEIARGHLSGLAEKFKKQAPRGEFVIVIAGKDQKSVL